MRIAIVTNIVKAVTGIPMFNRDLSKIFSEKGHEVVIFGKELLPVKLDRDFEILVGEHFNKINKRKDFDVVLCNGEMGLAVDHPRAINVFHGNYYGYANSVKHLVPEEVTKWRLERAEMQKASARGKYVVSVSNFATSGLNDSGIKVDKIINSSVNPSKFFYEEEPISNYSLFLSRNTYYEKGFDILKKLAKKGIRIKLFSDGEIDSPNVQNMGFIENGNLRTEYNRSQVLLFPSRFEGGSLVTLEAIACGCPLITTPVGYGYDIKETLPEFVAGGAEDIKGFTERYKLIKEDRKKYSKRALDYFWANHNPETFKKEWVDLIEGI